VTPKGKTETKVLPSSINTPQPLSKVFKGFNTRLANRPAALFRPIPLGIETLDKAFSGGVHPSDLTLIAGRQNVGKTIFITQIASNIARWAAEHQYPIVSWVCCYEHDEWELFTRLLCMESWRVDPANPVSYKTIIDAIVKVKEKEENQEDIITHLFEELPSSATEAMTEISKYFDHLILYYGQRHILSVENIQTIIREYEKENHQVLIPIMDYLQTIPPEIRMIQHAYDPMSGHLIIKRNLEALKNMCIELQIPALVVAAVDNQALSRPGPVHIEDVAGPEETSYTVDSGIILNYDVVKGTSISNAENRKASIRISVEKNRRGPVPLEWRHKFEGGAFYIDPKGEEIAFEDSYQKDRVNIVDEREDAQTPDEYLRE
jgi:replicative DNA helicase